MPSGTSKLVFIDLYYCYTVVVFLQVKVKSIVINANDFTCVFKFSCIRSASKHAQIGNKLAISEMFPIKRKKINLPGMSNSWPMGHMWPRMTMNAAKHKVINLLQKLFFLLISFC